MQQLGHERLLPVVLLTFVLSMQAATSPAATAAWNFGGGAHLVLRLPLSPAVTATAIREGDFFMRTPPVASASERIDKGTAFLNADFFHAAVSEFLWTCTSTWGWRT